MDAALVPLRFVEFAAAMLAFGSAAFRIYVPLGGSAIERPIVGTIRIAAALALVASLAIVPATAATMAGSPDAAWNPATLWAVLSATQFGRAWRWRLFFAAALAVAALWRQGRIAGWLVFAAAALALASLGWVGHASLMPGLAGVGHELNQSLHLLAGGAWLGGLPPLYLVLRRTDPGDPLSGEAVAHFSQMGYAAVGLVAATGAINTGLLVGSVGALFGTLYGRVLSVKIALYLAMVVLALANRLLLAPRLARRGSAAAVLARSVVAEQALGLAILAAVSLLGTLPPAAMGQAM